MINAPPRSYAVVALVLGGIGGCIGLAFNPKAMLSTYLAVWFVFTSIASGALGTLLTSYLVRGKWTRELYPILSKATYCLPALAVLSLPVLLGASQIYPWAADAHSLSGFKAAYLSVWFFVFRTVVYFIVLIALAIWACGAFGNDRAMKRSACIGLIVWPLVASFSGIDWLESIEPDFHSSIYGLLALGFQLLAGFAFALAWLLISERRHGTGNAGYGAILMSLILLWAYLHAMQYIVIWSGNIPKEVNWYLVRSSGGWGAALALLYVGQFVVPFFALLSGTVRKSARYLAGLAILTLALRLLESVVLVLAPQNIALGWLVLGTVCAALLIGACCFLRWDRIERSQRASGRAAAAA
jgi:hypothetical protein